MINSISPNIAVGIWTRTSGFSAPRINMSALGNHPSSTAPTSTFEPNAMIRQLSTQVQSSKSATEALRQVYQTLQRVEQTVSDVKGADSVVARKELDRLYEGLKEVQGGLTSLKDEVGTAAADRRIFAQVSNSVDQSLRAVGQVRENPKSLAPLRTAQNHLLSSIGRMENLSQNLEKASMNVMRISSSYASYPSSGNDLSSLYGLSTARIPAYRENLGLALDRVS